MLIKTSPINSHLSRLVLILERLEHRHMSACFLSLKSMQFCSLTKFESLQSKAEKELAELQKQMSMKLSSISESHLSVSNKMSSQIELLSTKNSKYKNSLKKAALMAVIPILSCANLRAKSECFQLLKSSKEKHMYSIKPFVKPVEKHEGIDTKPRERRETFDRDSVIEKILSDRDMKNNKSMHSARDRNSFISMEKQELVFDSPVRKNITEKENSAQEHELKVNQSKYTIKMEGTVRDLSPKMYHSPCSMQVLADFTNFEADHGNKLSSTAAFKTISSSPNKLAHSESLISRRSTKSKEEQKTVKRSSRQMMTMENIKLPKMTTLEPEIELRDYLHRKTSKGQMVMTDEDHAEPFEIIDSSDYR